MSEPTGRPPALENPVHTSLRLSDELLADIDAIAVREDTNRSQLMRAWAWEAVDDYGRDITHILTDDWVDFVEAQEAYLKAQNVFMRRLLLLFGGLLFVEVGLPFLPDLYALIAATVVISFAAVVGFFGWRDRTPPPDLPQPIDYRR